MAKKSKKTWLKRKVILEGVGTELDVAVITSVDIKKKAIYLEEMPDGRWRLTYTKSLIPEIEKLTALRIVEP